MCGNWYGSPDGLLAIVREHVLVVVIQLGLEGCAQSVGLGLQSMCKLMLLGDGHIQVARDPGLQSWSVHMQLARDPKPPRWQTRTQLVRDPKLLRLPAHMELAGDRKYGAHMRALKRQRLRTLLHLVGGLKRQRHRAALDLERQRPRTHLHLARDREPQNWQERSQVARDLERWSWRAILGAHQAG